MASDALDGTEDVSIYPCLLKAAPSSAYKREMFFESSKYTSSISRLAPSKLKVLTKFKTLCTNLFLFSGEDTTDLTTSLEAFTPPGL